MVFQLIDTPWVFLFQPNFDMLYNHVKQLLSNELLLTQMEKCALMEALVLISNQFKDYERQKAFLEELMSPVTTLWLSDEMKRCKNFDLSSSNIAQCKKYRT